MKKGSRPSPKIAPKKVTPISPETKVNENKPEPPARGKLARWWHIIILATLVIIFFSTAVWNLGDRHMPTSDFVPQQDPEEVSLALGNTTRVDKVYFLVQDASSLDVDIYWGTPESWNLAGNKKVSGVCHKWDYVDIGQDTRYIRLLFKSNSGRVGEVALFSGDSKLAISGVSTASNMTAAQALIDEQQLVGNPGAARSTTYFDEIYYVWTAEQYLNLHEITNWEAQTNWDHPLLSKLLITASMSVFGHNPFGWRIAGVIFATLTIIFVFLLARRMFGTPRAGLVAAFLLTFDCMHFAQARIATPDTFLIFFFVGMVYFFYRYWQDTSHGGKYLFWSLVFFGCGFSCKWFIMYGFIGLMLLLIIQKVRERKISKSEVYWFIGGVVAAISIYMICYIPYFLAPLEHGGLSNWWKMQWDMFNFHAHLAATHPSSSPWYTWPFMLNPVWFYAGYFPATRAYIASFGNPALWWATMPIMIPTAMVVINWLANSMKNKVANFITRALRPLWREVGHRREVALFILIPFLTQWLFFAPVGRVVFIYHFYPCLIFVILALTLWIEWLWTRFKWGKWVVGGYLVLNVACFIFFFPAISGLPMSNGYWDSLQWMVHWIW
jgi:4-amino-4-deoxy-L-arabinose transferase-like glycosyltransferase